MVFRLAVRIPFSGSVSLIANSPGTKGSGAGTKNFKNFPNILSINIGESREKSLNQEIKCILETNIDDMTPEHLGRFIDYSISMGALDTWITPYYGKKNRLGHKLSLLCNESDSEKFSNLIIDQTSSLGIRLFRIERLVADREIRNFNSTMGKIKIKLKFHNNELHSVKPEFEDINRISNETGRSIISINKEIEYEINKDFFGNTIKAVTEVNRKVIVASEEEQNRNSRSRSAKLRIAEKNGNQR